MADGAVNLKRAILTQLLAVYEKQRAACFAQQAAKDKS